MSALNSNTLRTVQRVFPHTVEAAANRCCTLPGPLATPFDAGLSPPGSESKHLGAATVPTGPWLGAVYHPGAYKRYYGYRLQAIRLHPTTPVLSTFGRWGEAHPQALRSC